MVVGQRVSLQIVGRAQRRARRQQLGAARRKDLVLQQQLDLETGVVPGAIADPDVSLCARNRPTEAWMPAKASVSPGSSTRAEAVSSIARLSR